VEPFLKQAAEEMGSKMKSLPVSLGKVPYSIDPEIATAAINSQDIDRKMATLAGIGLDKKVSDIVPKLVNQADDAFSILKNPEAYISADPVENALRLANEASGGETITLDDLSRIAKSGAMDDTGVKWFDNMIRGVRNFKISVGGNGGKVMEVGKTVMDKYDQLLGVFRMGKVGASPSSWMNATVGNGLMTHMMGDLNTDFLGRLGQVFDLFSNKPGAALKIERLISQAGGDTESIRNFLREYRTAARDTFGGLNFLDARANAEKILMAARDSGVVSSVVKVDDIINPLNEAMNELAVLKKSMESSTEFKSGTSLVREAFEKSGETVGQFERGTGMLSNEAFNSKASAQMFKLIEDKAKANPSNLAWKLLDATFNKLPSGYEKIDQTFKLTTFLRGVVDGYTIDQLRLLRNFVDINPEELTRYVSKGNIYRYRIAPRTALELANVAYLNYSAMPAAVRVLRNLPILGSPFISFMYGMAIKTGQTLAYNPEAFNKVTFALNEFSGTKTPLEKKALSQKFYSYLNRPGMYRLPGFLNFFDKNPVYINLANMIPYYSLNMFAPTQTSYGDTPREKLVELWQKSPIMKDPVGTTMFDYLIQPLILGEAIRPQGQFGQPLYPIDATAAEKALYGTRTLGEAFMPNIYSYAGLMTPDAIADYIPSYRWRQLARAKVGENQLGISGKESPASRTIRTVLQTTGIPVQAPVNTSFNANQL
jgi:hypothetical protein